MKHNHFFGYERNHYFYGKLLTEHDFENEQKYGNDKRRLINRYLHGAGVVSGLQVVAVDEKTISVETGFALDFAGREIVLDVPVMKKISLIDGYETVAEQKDQSYCYLCIEYDEQPAGQMTSTINNQQEFARYKEGCHLYFTTLAPQDMSYRTQEFYERQLTLYQDQDLRIVQILPRILQTDGSCPIRIVIFSEREQQDISLHMTEKLEHLSFHGEALLSIDLAHILLGKGEKKEFVYELQVKRVSDCEARIMSAAPLRLITHKVEQVVPTEINVGIPVTEQHPEEALTNRFYKEGFEEISRTCFMNGIYLAKIELIRGGNLLIVDSVVNDPFQQKVFSNYLLQALSEWQKQREAGSAGKSGSQPDSMNEVTDKPRDGDGQKIRISRGKVTIDMGIGGKRGQTFFSEKIVHGLGLGIVNIQLAMENQIFLYSGSQEVFPDMSVKAELAARVDPKTGTFVIGARLLEGTSDQLLTIYWTALTTAATYGESSKAPRIYIQPSVLEMRVREERILKAELEGVQDKAVSWKCEGGDINQNGIYTAPNEAGVYAITAVSRADEKLTASIYAVVREEQ